jgi:5-methylcytosine-specific restriction protein A
MSKLILPDVSPAAIEQALKHFDRKLRNAEEWAEWEDNQAHRYAIRWEDRLYPAKKIASLATNTPVASFSGGVQTNKYLEARGYEMVSLHRADKSPSPYEIRFELGRIYDRRTEIHGPFGGSWQSGISPSAQSPAVFIFSGDSGAQFGYQDYFDDLGVFHFTGEGQTGDMQLNGGNKSILKHAEDGRSLHVFRSLGKKGGKSLGQSYLGEFVCADISWKEGPDRNKGKRKIVVFQLVPVSRVDESSLDITSDEPIPSTLDKARQLALQSMESSESANPGESIRTIYKRSLRVKNYVLMRAAGKCESCGNGAPFFRKDGSPYLEPHHINRLSDGGLDHPRYIGAVCPACHREIHYGLNGGAKNEKLRDYVKEIESTLVS